MLLLDEPLSALDARVRVHLRRELKQLQRRLGITTIMVTHDQEEALSLADTVAVMDHGTVEQVGTPGADLPASRTSRFVADFVGHSNCPPVQVGADGQVELAGFPAPLPGRPIRPDRRGCSAGPEDSRSAARTATTTAGA